MSPAERRSVAYAQNFLRSRQLVDRLLDRSSIGPDDLVCEIGLGRGRITERLARRCRQVVAIEKDARLAALLLRRLAGTPNVVVREADFLRYDLPRGPYKVFASIPFNVTTEIVTKLTAASGPPDDAYLIVQREAAARIAGGRRESLYGLLLKPWFEPSVVHRFRRTDFAPAPRVEAVLLRLRKRGPPLVGPRESRLYRGFVAHSFTAWHPSLLETLAGIVGRRGAEAAVVAAGIDADATPSGVCFEQWLRLFRTLQLNDVRLARRIGGAEQRLRRRQQALQKVHRTRTAPPGGRTTAGRSGKAGQAPIDDCRPPPRLIGRGPWRGGCGESRGSSMPRRSARRVSPRSGGSCRRRPATTSRSRWRGRGRDRLSVREMCRRWVRATAGSTGTGAGLRPACCRPRTDRVCFITVLYQLTTQS